MVQTWLLLHSSLTPVAYFHRHTQVLRKVCHICNVTTAEVMLWTCSSRVKCMA
jgi:hypothetical protein